MSGAVILPNNLIIYVAALSGGTNVYAMWSKVIAIIAMTFNNVELNFLIIEIRHWGVYRHSYEYFPC